jgi:hypothetical protein
VELTDHGRRRRAGSACAAVAIAAEPGGLVMIAAIYARPALASLLCALLMGGCVTSMTVEYRDPATGQTGICQRAGAFGIIPASNSGADFASCKNGFERRGFVRSDGLR